MQLGDFTLMKLRSREFSQQFFAVIGGRQPGDEICLVDLAVLPEEGVAGVALHERQVVVQLLSLQGDRREAGRIFRELQESRVERLKDVENMVLKLKADHQ